jgi:hypothetical protein
MVQLQNARDNQKRKRAEDDRKKQEAEAGESFLVCRQSITEELTSKAPCCGQAFQLESGCLAVFHADCKAVFCGICLSPEHMRTYNGVAVNSNDEFAAANMGAHDNVLACSHKYFGKEGYYLRSLPGDSLEQKKEVYVKHIKQMVLKKLTDKLEACVDANVKKHDICVWVPLVDAEID